MLAIAGTARPFIRFRQPLPFGFPVGAHLSGVKGTFLKKWRGSCDNAAALRIENFRTSWSSSWSGTPAARCKCPGRPAP